MPSQSKGVLGFMKCNQKSSASTDRFLGCIDVGDWELGSFCLGGNEKNRWARVRKKLGRQRLKKKQISNLAFFCRFCCDFSVICLSFFLSFQFCLSFCLSIFCHVNFVCHFCVMSILSVILIVVFVPFFLCVLVSFCLFFCHFAGCKNRIFHETLSFFHETLSFFLETLSFFEYISIFLTKIVPKNDKK